MANIFPNIMHSSLPVYILAGGQSSRMGQDKGLLRFNGEPMVSHIIKKLQSPLYEIVIVSNNRVYEQLGYKVICDLIPGVGPAGGIYTALSHTSFEKIFICGCDMPLVTGEAMGFIIQQADKHAEIVVPVKNEKTQPLFGVYAKNCLTNWKRLIAGGMTKLKEMVNHFDLKQIDADNHPLFSENIFMNVNNRKDFDNALKLISYED